jgi:O-antigen/teichoic acid export membrane protein
LNPFKKLAGQTAIYGLPTIAGRLLNYLLVPLYTRVFVPAEYGIVTEIYAYVAFAFVILTYGMETAFFRFSTTYQFKDKVYSTSLLALISTSTIFTLMVFLTAPSIATVMGYQQNEEYIKWFALILAADAVSSIPYANLRLINRPFRFAFIKITNIVTNIALNLVFIVFIPMFLKNNPEASHSYLIRTFYNPEIGVGYIFISNLVASLLTLAMLLPDISKVKLIPDVSLLKKMLSYSWPLLIFGFAGVINETFDRVILKHLLPGNDAMAQLGIYGACYKISILMTLFIQTYRYAAEPFFFSHSGTKDPQVAYARLMHYFIIVCLFIFLLIMLNIDIVILFVGSEFREGAAVIPILLIANMFLGVFYNLSIWFKLTDRTKAGAMISLLGAALTLVLNILLIPIMGYMGAAWATFVCYAFMMIISWYLGRKYYPVNYNLKGAGLYVLITVVIYTISIATARLENSVEIGLNLILLTGFMLLVYLVEKKKLIKVNS